MHLADTIIQHLAVHAVGNKQLEEPLTLSHELLNVSDEVKNMLKTYFLFPFKSEEYFQFFDEDGVDRNEVYQCAAAIFENPDDLLEQSLYLAQHLYNQCTTRKSRTASSMWSISRIAFSRTSRWMPSGSSRLKRKTPS